MKEVHPRLFVGKDQDFTDVGLQEGWAIVHACKEPYHRMAVGYRNMAAPKNEEYLYAIRDHRICLNLVDADDPAFISPELMRAALLFINQRIALGNKLLVHCNQGYSRGPGVAMAWLGSAGHLPRAYQQALRAFIQLYPDYHPKGGIQGYLQTNWGALCGGSLSKKTPN